MSVSPYCGCLVPAGEETPRGAPAAVVEEEGVEGRDPMTARHWKYFFGYVAIQALVAFLALEFHEWGWI